MLSTRVIPTLLVDGQRLVKGIHFKSHRYVGDPLNAIRIFNEKEVDELMLLDITATRRRTTISPDLVKRVSTECLMPITVGGGVNSVACAKDLLNLGAEKICLGSAIYENPVLVTQIADAFGSQSVICSLDVKRHWRGGYHVYSHSGYTKLCRNPVEVAIQVEDLGAGEILLNSIDRDGTHDGYDIDLIQRVANAVKIPVIALGGAGNLTHFAPAIRSGATALAAGSFFVFHGRRRAVLINYPCRREIDAALSGSECS